MHQWSQIFARTVIAPTELDGRRLREGDCVTCWATANRDPSVLETPDVVRLDRSADPESSP